MKRIPLKKLPRELTLVTKWSPGAYPDAIQYTLYSLAMKSPKKILKKFITYRVMNSLVFIISFSSGQVGPWFFGSSISVRSSVFRVSVNSLFVVALNILVASSYRLLAELKVNNDGFLRATITGKGPCQTVRPPIIANPANMPINV